MTGTEGILLATTILASVLAVLGFFSGREERAGKAAERRGHVDGKLDSILGLTNRVDDLEDTVQVHEIEISKLKDSSKRAHERIDDIKGGRDGK